MEGVELTAYWVTYASNVTEYSNGAASGPTHMLGNTQASIAQAPGPTAQPNDGGELQEHYLSFGELMLGDNVDFITSANFQKMASSTSVATGEQIHKTASCAYNDIPSAHEFRLRLNGSITNISRTTWLASARNLGSIPVTLTAAEIIGSPDYLPADPSVLDGVSPPRAGQIYDHFGRAFDYSRSTHRIGASAATADLIEEEEEPSPDPADYEAASATPETVTITRTDTPAAWVWIVAEDASPTGTADDTFDEDEAEIVVTGVTAGTRDVWVSYTSDSGDAVKVVDGVVVAAVPDPDPSESTNRSRDRSRTR